MPNQFSIENERFYPILKIDKNFGNNFANIGFKKLPNGKNHPIWSHKKFKAAYHLSNQLLLKISMLQITVSRLVTYIGLSPIGPKGLKWICVFLFNIVNF